MELPESLYQLIGEFALTFPKLNDIEQVTEKKRLAYTIAALYPEYSDCIFTDYKIPFFKDFKGYYKSAEQKLLNAVKTAISYHKLEGYNDVIIENYALTPSQLNTIMEYVYQNTYDINETCRVYCALGYSGFDDRYGNEDNLLNLIILWTEFAKNKGIKSTEAQCLLLKYFIDIDSKQFNFSILEAKGQHNAILKFFPFTFDNVTHLVDFVLKYDDIESETLVENTNVQPFNYSVFSKDENHNLALLCNYYVYLFNKANGIRPYSLFVACATAKLYLANSANIYKSLTELSKKELDSLVIDYCIELFGDTYRIPQQSFSILPQLSEHDSAINFLIYKLYNKYSITIYDIIDFWTHIVIRRGLTYLNSKMNETNVILKVSGKEYPDEGKLLLPWKYVRFVDGKAFIYHPNHEKGENSTLPYIFETENANKEYMNIPKSILWNLPFIMCESVNGSIVKIDNQFVQHVIDNIAFIHKTYYNRVKSVYSSATYTATDILNRYKSEQLDYLKKRQNKKYPITPIIELSKTSIIKEEPALLFTISEGNDSMTLVYENVSVSRATYIFIVESASYHKASKIISSYFSSDRSYKRSELQFSRDMFNKTDGFLRVIRVLHDDKTNWKYAISFYSKNQK